MTTVPYDAIVAGAGPAGAAAAFFLRQAGKQVLVLEKDSLPRYKTCGGGISRCFLQSVFPFSFDSLPCTMVNRMTYDIGPLNWSVTVPAPSGQIAMVMRSELDNFLLNHSGAEVRPGAEVTAIEETSESVQVTTRDGQQFSARYLVGADGSKSAVARLAGLRRKGTAIPGIEVEAQPAPEILQAYAGRPVLIFGEIKAGYLWIFPKTDHLSVGIAAYHSKPGELQSTLRRVMLRYGISLSGLALHGHPIPIYSGMGKIATRRILLAGDAAGLVDPLSGEGIRYAIKSGKLAAQCLIQDQPERYPALVWRQIGINHSFAQATAAVFYQLNSLCLLLGAPNPFTTRAISDVLSDRAATAEIMLRAIATLPAFVAIELAAAVSKVLKGRGPAERLRERLYGYF